MGSNETLSPIEEHPVEGKDTEPRDELVQSLLPKLSTEDQETLWAEIHSGYTDALIDREGWESRLVVWDDQYYGKLGDKKFPWRGASNLNVPLTMVGIETLKPRLVEAILGANPPVLVVPVELSDQELQSRVELFLNWQLQTELRLEPTIYESAHLFLNPGTVVAKVFWKVDRRRKKYLRYFPTGTSPEQILQAIFGNTPPILERIAGKPRWEGEIRYKDGPPLSVALELKVLETQIQVLVDREESIELPSVELIDTADIIAPARSGQDVQFLPWIQHRLWLTEDDLRKKAKSGRFFKDAVQELLTAAAPTGDETQSDSAEIRESRDDTEGVDGQGGSSITSEQYEVLEDYRRYDIDDDGLLEEIVTWICPKLKNKVLGWDYLDNVYAHGKRPLVVGRYFPIPFRFYGLSFPEIVRNIQEEINTIHNQRVDFGTLQNMPWYFYRASSMQSPTPVEIRPGVGVPIENPASDVMMPHFQGSSAFGQAEEALLYQYFERLTGLTDLALGRQPNRVGATRTATGVASLLSEAGLRFKTSMSAFQRFWIEIFSHVLALNQQYLPPGKEFRVTGKYPERIRIEDRNEIAGRFDIRLAATTEVLNREIMREDSATILTTLANPAWVQVGLVGVRGIDRVLRDFLRAYGKDPDFYLETQTNEVVRSPEEELAILIGGGEIRPNPSENVQEHLMKHQTQLRDPVVIQVLSAEALSQLQRHIVATTQLSQAMMMSQAMGTKGVAAGPQAQNALIGQVAPQQAGTRTNLPGPAAQGGMNEQA